MRERSLDVALAVGAACEANIEHWVDGSLATGLAGYAVLFSALESATGSQRWRRAAHLALQKSVRLVDQTDPSLHVGLGGVLLAAHFASADGWRYAKLRAAIGSRIAGLLSEQSNRELSTRDVDLVTGTAGNAVVARLEAGLKDLARAQLDSIALRLSTPRPILWRRDHETPDHVIDCGMSHGLAGLFAAGVGIGASVAYFRHFILSVAVETEAGVRWPQTLDAEDSSLTFFPPPRTWCYGNVGIALALASAGKALSDRVLVDSGKQAFLAVSQRFIGDPTLDASLCHGLAGAAAIANYLSDGDGDEFSIERDVIVSHLVENYSASLVGGFDFRVRSPVAPGWELALLSGGAGVALTMLTSSGHCSDDWISLLGGYSPA